MKKIFLLIVLLFSCVYVNAQDVFLIKNVNNLRRFENVSLGKEVLVTYGDSFKVNPNGLMWYKLYDGISAPDDSLNVVKPASYIGVPSDYAWILTDKYGYSMLPSVSGNDNKVAVVNGTGTGYILSPFASLMPSMTLVASGDSVSITMGGTQITTNKLPIPTGFGWTTITLANTDRAFNTSYQVSKWTQISLSVQVSANLSITGGQIGSIILERSTNNSTWAYCGEVTTGNTGILTIGLNTTQTGAAPTQGDLQPTEYYRMRTTGTGTFTFKGGYIKTYN